MAQEMQPDLAGKLTFDGDKGAGRSKWVAIFLALLLIGWMGSGYILPSQGADDEQAQATAPQAVTVAVIPSEAQDVQLVLTAEGQSAPDRVTGVQAEASGQVVSVSVARGDLVECRTGNRSAGCIHNRGAAFAGADTARAGHT